MTTNSNEIYVESFTEMSSVSDLKSIPSASAISTQNNSPIQSAESESEAGTNPAALPASMSSSSTCPAKQKNKWPKFKRFVNTNTGEEAIYEFVESSSSSSSPSPKQLSSKGIFALCSELVTLSSISLFVASNLFAFTVGMLIGRRITYELEL